MTDHKVQGTHVGQDGKDTLVHTSSQDTSPALTVINPGMLALIEDRGRFGYAGMGVTPSGCFDRLSFARANHVLGNSQDAPMIEILHGGFEARFECATTFTILGTRAPVEITHPGERPRMEYTQAVYDAVPGTVVRLSGAEAGMRAYFAIRGGFDVPTELGSASRDTMSNLGPAPLAAGDVVNAGHFVEEDPWVPRVRAIPPVWPKRSQELLTVILGPRSHWFTTTAIFDFLWQEYVVSGNSDRIGVRLEGPKPLTRSINDELASEGTVRGAVQIPANGQPVIFGPDHPVTGGYPVIGVLSARSADRVAQLRPGDPVRFTVR